MDHVLDRLSEFMDGALPDAEKRSIQEHLDACTACRVELEDMRRISKMVAELPQKPLPVGFMQRLERKRQAGPEEKPAAGFFLPFPARMAAFAASGLVVGLVVYQGVKDKRLARPQEGMLLSQTASDMKYPSPPAPSSPEAESARGVAGMAGGAAAPAPAPEAFPAGAADALDKAAAPVASADDGARLRAGKDGYTNESLQGFLQKEREKLGIQKIIVPNQGYAPGSGGGGAPEAYQMANAQPPPQPTRSMRQARVQMQQMAEDFERQVQARQPPSVKLGDQSTPGLLADEDKNAGGASGGPLAESQDSTAMAKRDFPADELQRQEEKRAKKKALSEADMARRREAAKKAEESSSAMLVRAGRPASVHPAKPAAPASRDGAAATSQAALDRLWSGLGTDVDKPQADFSTEMVVVVFAPHAGDEALEIVSAAPAKRSFAVRYRVVPASSGAPHTGFAMRVVPKSDLPLSFKKVPN